MKALKLIPNNTFTYICVEDLDLPKDEQTVFDLKVLTPQEEAMIEDSMGNMRDGGLEMTLGAQNLLALHIGLMSVSNFYDEDGTAVNIERDHKAPKIKGYITPLSEATLKRIPKDVRGELARAIISGQALSEDDVKN